MSPAQPTGDPAPSDGLLPASVLDGAERRSLSLYVHVPYCSVRCGYCDFNTYAAEDFGDGVNRLSYAEDAIRELDLAAGVLTRSGLPARPLSTVFFGGGTPTRLPAEDLARILRAGIERFGIVDGAEVTTEANPDSVTREDLALLKEAGFTRVSFGMQSAVPRVLAVLDRTHTPANVPKVVSWAREVGLQTSVDLISGAPGETLAEWETSVRAAIDCAPDHISAYSLIVEPGTKLAAQIARGEHVPVDDDTQADMYQLGDELLSAAGYRWYEVSNWARDPQGSGVHRARHNVAYWEDQDWWGIGPGAHSHLAGVRFWNAKHPAAYAQRLATGVTPAVGRERPDADARRLERIMLAVRTVGGLPTAELVSETPGEAARIRGAIAELIAAGLLDGRAAVDGRIIPTLEGRLRNDAIVRALAGF
mgnify:CR=1 FL=1